MPNYNYQLIDMCLRKNAGFDLRGLWNIGKRAIGRRRAPKPATINNIKSRIPVRIPANNRVTRIGAPDTQRRYIELNKTKNRMVRQGIPSGAIDDSEIRPRPWQPKDPNTVYLRHPNMERSFTVYPELTPQDYRFAKLKPLQGTKPTLQRTTPPLPRGIQPVVGHSMNRPTPRRSVWIPKEFTVQPKTTPMFVP